MILFFLHYALLLLFGILLAASFADIRLNRKNLLLLFCIFLICGTLQLVALEIWDERLVWKLYPLIVHLPVGLAFKFCYRKKIATVIAAITTAYLCCQPAKWIGILCGSLTGSGSAEYIARIAMLILVGILVYRYMSPAISEIYGRDTLSVATLGSIPIVYYLFDYGTGVYTDLWIRNIRATVEFVPFVLCMSYLIFCVAYHREYERKMDAVRKTHMIRIATEQQAKEMKVIQQREREIRILRHDMRHFLHNISLCLEEEGARAAKSMIDDFLSEVESTTVQRYCENATVNYILSHCADRCKEADIAFLATVELEALSVDELLFSSVLSNALDNAVNAQMELPPAERQIKLTLRHSKNKLLLSVSNPFVTEPVFVDGLPVSDRCGHGYGTQSIRHMTERMGGNCRFTTEDHTFILRVVL